MQVGGNVQPNQPPGNVVIVNPASTALVGQPVSFVAATAVPRNPGAVIQNYTWSYSDGGTDYGQRVSHVFSSPGTYSVTLTVTDSTGASAQTGTTISITPSAPPVQPGVTVTYQAGWNLVAQPTGATIPGAIGPLYTLQTGNTNYQTSSTTTSGFGYWAYFNSPTTVSIPYTGAQSVTKSLQPSQFIMIGNSSSSPATVTGADIVYTYNSAITSGNPYTATTVLQPGQGAWALSYSGGNITISSPGP